MCVFLSITLIHQRLKTVSIVIEIMFWGRSVRVSVSVFG